MKHTLPFTASNQQVKRRKLETFISLI